MTQATQLLKGVLEGCTLTILYNGEMYGYKIVEALRKSGFKDVQEATVYPLLTRLNKKELLTYSKRPSEFGPQRKYYRLTDKGINELETFYKNWNTINKNVTNIIKEYKL